MCAVADVVERVHHSRHEHAGAERDRFAGLEVDLDLGMARTELAHDADESIDLVVGARDVMTAAEVDPLHAIDEVAELGLERGDRTLEGVAVVLTQRVKVQAIEAVEVARADVAARGAEPAAQPGGIVERDLGLLVLVVDAQTCAGELSTM
jgi:hypothetical protein